MKLFGTVARVVSSWIAAAGEGQGATWPRRMEIAVVSNKSLTIQYGAALPSGWWQDFDNMPGRAKRSMIEMQMNASIAADYFRLVTPNSRGAGL